jgi:hypothetical protein
MASEIPGLRSLRRSGPRDSSDREELSARFGRTAYLEWIRLPFVVLGRKPYGGVGVGCALSAPRTVSSTVWPC